ncbi:hypothetical protein ACTVCO_06965 [Sanguibacter sp. A247]|uniref:hypothetical protein n=1 Tax=unclassified Sanguibacter TaxID=2645534 RepID=UPI003FD82D5B
MTQILLVTSPRQMLLLAAAIDHGALPATSAGRIVALADTVPVPETGPELSRSAALAPLRNRTTAIVSWTELIAPLRPASFVPRRDEQPVWERVVREAWSVPAGPVSLVLADPTSGPGRALVRIFPHARLTLLADRLERWAPFPKPLGDGVPGRLDLLVAPELVPGLRPRVLDEHGTATVVVPVRRLVDVVTEVVRPGPPGVRPGGPGTGRTALVLLDPPGDLGLDLPDGDGPPDPTAVSLAEALTDDLAGLVAAEVRSASITEVVLVAHPRTPARLVQRAVRAVRATGATVRAADPDVPTEVLVHRDRPALVLGTASTSLVTALALGAPDVRALGTAETLRSLTPYHHPARTALTVVDRLLAPGADPTASDVVRLVDAVTYVMYPQRVPHLRPAAVALLVAEGQHDAQGRAAWRRWVRKRRVERLGLLDHATSRDDAAPSRDHATSRDDAAPAVARAVPGTPPTANVAAAAARGLRVPRPGRLRAAWARLTPSGHSRRDA